MLNKWLPYGKNFCQTCGNHVLAACLTYVEKSKKVKICSTCSPYGYHIW